MFSYYIKEGETILDVCLNSTGSISNWDAILEANNFTEWNPILAVGQEIIIPDSVIINTNVTNVLKEYPICNNLNTNILNQINELIPIFVNSVLFDDELEIDAQFDNDGNDVLFN